MSYYVKLTDLDVFATLRGRPNIQIPFRNLPIGQSIVCWGFTGLAVPEAVAKANRRNHPFKEFVCHTMDKSTGGDWAITHIR